MYVRTTLASVRGVRRALSGSVRTSMAPQSSARSGERMLKRRYLEKRKLLSTFWKVLV
jgi:hypothetical protein